MTETRRAPAHPLAGHLLDSLPPLVRTILVEAQRAPSAHNAQPWRLLVDSADPTRVTLRYDFTEYLPHDPEDRDAMLATGAYVETVALAAARHGAVLEVEPVFRRVGDELVVCRFRVVPAGTTDVAVTRLAEAAADRHTNRGGYRRTPLTAELTQALTELGCRLVPPRRIAATVARASALSWRDERFVADLAAWTREEADAPDGMTATGLMLARYEWRALQLAFRSGRLPRPLALLFASRDVRLLRTAPAVAVLTAEGTSPEQLFDAGRRLLRAWVEVGAAGYVTHPISISVDRPETRPVVRALAGGGEPVAVFRIGVPRRSAPRSNRVPLTAVLRPLTPAGRARAPGRSA
jgi:hypothetical protein